MNTLKNMRSLAIASVTITVAIFIFYNPENTKVQMQHAKEIAKIPEVITQVEHVIFEQISTSVENPPIKNVEPDIVLPEIEPVIEETPKHTDKIKILEETYSHNVVIDEYWSEENTVRSKKEKWKNLSFNELLANKQIHMMENQLMEPNYDATVNHEIKAQIKQLIMEKSTLLDLQCGKSLCRVVANLPYSASQYELLNNLTSKLEWIDKSFAKVEINPDDSRILTLYLTRKLS